MKNHFSARAIWLTLVSLSTLNPQLSTVFAQGSLTPPGAPAPTMKSLDQIEPRTPISSAPFTIAVPGSYYLTTNLTISGGDAITIATNGVTLDLNGFTIASSAPSATGYGIFINSSLISSLRDLTILNGFIQGGVTANGNGVYSGSGFGYGIYGYPVQNVRVSGVSISGCLYSGIYLGNGDSTVVESCTVRTVGNYGIVASIIKASVAKDCGDSAISGSQVADCRGESTGSSYGVIANTALNCYGYSSSSYGLYAATTAQNCQGNSGTGIGLHATTAQNCYGASSSGLGLDATTAQNCYGTSSNGDGLYSITAQNCYGHSSSFTGLRVYAIAIGCYGYSGSAILQPGLDAYIANSSQGESASGSGQIVVFKYNMP
jgi:hypothetical protein